jgi:formate dehydrogenase (coenzyme F420) beta subunit
VTDKETKKLHQLVEAALPGLDVVIGWGTGFDALRSVPIFVKKAEDIAKLTVNPLCAQNLTGYLAKTPPIQPTEGKKVGVCVKGCDSRSLVTLIQEKFINRDQIHIFGVPCSGTVDWRRVMKITPLVGVKSAEVEGDRLMVEDTNGRHEFPLSDVLARKCQRCQYPNPIIHDDLVGEPVTPRVSAEEAYKDVEAIEEMALGDRLSYWQDELDRCIRCYACRNACPLCVCQEKCIAETREPRWLTQRVGTSEKFLFHFIHAMHLAGRCSECGECERVCPKEIPVTLIKEKLNKVTKELMDYEAGLDVEAVPPLLTFNPGETGI